MLRDYKMSLSMRVFLVSLGLLGLAIAVFQQSGLEIPYVINSVTNITQSQYQIEMLAPDEMALPAPNSQTQAEIGIKITNKTSQPKFFCLCPVELAIFDAKGARLVLYDDIVERDIGFLGIYYQEIQPGESYTYYSGQIYFSNESGKIKLHFANRDQGDYNVYGKVFSGDHFLSLRYSNVIDYYSPNKYPGRNKNEIRGIWTGRIDSPSKKVRFVSGGQQSVN